MEVLVTRPFQTALLLLYTFICSLIQHASSLLLLQPSMRRKFRVSFKSKEQLEEEDSGLETTSASSEASAGALHTSVLCWLEAVLCWAALTCAMRAIWCCIMLCSTLPCFAAYCSQPNRRDLSLQTIRSLHGIDQKPVKFCQVACRAFS